MSTSTSSPFSSSIACATIVPSGMTQAEPIISPSLSWLSYVTSPNPSLNVHSEVVSSLGSGNVIDCEEERENREPLPFPPLDWLLVPLELPVLPSSLELSEPGLFVELSEFWFPSVELLEPFVNVPSELFEPD